MKSNCEQWLVPVPWDNNNNKKHEALRSESLGVICILIQSRCFRNKCCCICWWIGFSCLQTPLRGVQKGYSVTFVILIDFISPLLTQKYLNDFCLCSKLERKAWRGRSGEVGIFPRWQERLDEAAGLSFAVCFYVVLLSFFSLSWIKGRK